jgi:hypothetical protein
MAMSTAEGDVARADQAAGKADQAEHAARNRYHEDQGADH